MFPFLSTIIIVGWRWRSVQRSHELTLRVAAPSSTTGMHISELIAVYVNYRHLTSKQFVVLRQLRKRLIGSSTGNVAMNGYLWFHSMLITWCKCSRDDFNRHIALDVNCKAQTHPTVDENNQNDDKNLLKLRSNAEITFNRTHPSFIYLSCHLWKLWTADRSIVRTGCNNSQ